MNSQQPAPVTTRFVASITACVVCLFIALHAPRALAAAPAQQPPQADAKPQAPAEPDRAALEQAFEKSMRRVAFEGRFTIKGQDKQPARAERYIIDKVVKQHGDTWVFYARVQYGGKDVPIAIPLEVKWAGDTPVISLTRLTIPGLGTYTARVLIYGDQYAGTWDAGDHGGHMAGYLVPAPAHQPAPQTKPAAPDSSQPTPAPAPQAP